MEVHASCKMDLDAIKALIRLEMFKKADPRKRMIFWSIVYGVLLTVCIVNWILFGFNTSNFAYVLVAILAPLLVFYMYFIVPKIRYKAMQGMRQSENKYVFLDDMLKISTAGQEYNGTAEVGYTLLVRAYETSHYFFLFETKNQVFLVDKSTLTGGTAEEIRSKLTSVLRSKYILCRY